MDAVHQLLPDLLPHGAAGQQVFCAIDLGGFTQDSSTAVGHQNVHRRAQRGVGADAGVTVRPTTLQTDGDVGRAAGFTLHGIGAGQHLVDEANAFFHRLAGAAGVLDVEGAEVVALRQMARREPGVDLVGLTAQAHHQHCRKVGVGGVPGQRALQDLHAHTFGVHAAACAVGERNDAVHVREGGQRLRVGLAREVVGNGAGGGGRAVHAGQHTDVVAGGHAAVGAFDAHEGGGARGWRGLHVRTKRIVARKVTLVGAHVEVLCVDVFARRNGLAGKPNDLVVAAHRLARGEGTHCHLVAGRDQATHGHTFNGGAADELGACNHHVVGGVQADKRSHRGFLERMEINRTFWAATAQGMAHR